MFQAKHDWQTGLGLVRRGGKRRREPGAKRPGVSQETKRFIQCSQNGCVIQKRKGGGRESPS